MCVTPPPLPRCRHMERAADLAAPKARVTGRSRSRPTSRPPATQVWGVGAAPPPAAQLAPALSAAALRSLFGGVHALTSGSSAVRAAQAAVATHVALGPPARPKNLAFLPAAARLVASARSTASAAGAAPLPPSAPSFLTDKEAFTRPESASLSCCGAAAPGRRRAERAELASRRDRGRGAAQAGALGRELSDE